MTAPTTRETADHAELARLAEDASGGPWSVDADETGRTIVASSVEIVARDTRHNSEFIAAANPATVLALLSEIAALRVRAEEADALASKHFVALREKQDDAAVLKHGKLEAERQRDEAVGLLREVCIIQNNGDLDARIFRLLANQGADQ